MVKGAKQEVSVPFPYRFHRHGCVGESEMRGVKDREFMCGHGALIWSAQWY